MKWQWSQKQALVSSKQTQSCEILAPAWFSDTLARALVEEAYSWQGQIPGSSTLSKLTYLLYINNLKMLEYCFHLQMIILIPTSENSGSNLKDPVVMMPAAVGPEHPACRHW